MQERRTGRDIHGQAIHAREKEQDFLKALQLLSEALFASTEAGDHEDIAGISGSRSNTYLHLYEQTGNKDFLILAECEAVAQVKIAEENNIPEKALPYRDLAKFYEQTEDYSAAVENYKKALSFIDSPSLARPAVKPDLMAHLGFSQYMSGDKENGLNTMDEAISKLEADTEANKYEHDVWLSGAYMRKAYATKDKDTLEKAREIIYGNEELKLRQEQFVKLASKLETN